MPPKRSASVLLRIRCVIFLTATGEERANRTSEGYSKKPRT
jgi:hypothetical protein